MKVDYSQEEQFTIIKIWGTLETAEIEEFKESIKEFLKKLETRGLILDLKGLDYISSAGIGVFVEIFKALKEQNIEIRFCNVGHFIENIFKITSLDAIFPMVPDQEAAKRSLKSALSK